MLTAASCAVVDFDPCLVVAGVQARVDLQAGAGRGRADQVDDHLQALKRPSAPVEADVAEHAMLDFVPLRRPGREMADAVEIASSLASFCSSVFHRWVRLELLPPPSAVIVRHVALG